MMRLHLADDPRCEMQSHRRPRVGPAPQALERRLSVPPCLRGEHQISVSSVSPWVVKTADCPGGAMMRSTAVIKVVLRTALRRAAGEHWASGRGGAERLRGEYDRSDLWLIAGPP